MIPKWMSLFALLAIAVGAAIAEEGDGDDLDALKAQNTDLEKRIEQLEKSNLKKDVEGYLETSGPMIKQESKSLLPGGMGISFYGQIKLRPELRDHVYSARTPQGQASFSETLQRVRFGANIQVSENISAVVEIQDTRSWGGAGNTIANLRGVDLKQGYMKFDKLGGSATGIQAGRFTMLYGVERLIGPLEWVIQGRSFDGMRVTYHPENWWLDAFAVTNRETAPADNADQQFGGFYGGYGKNLEFFALYLHDDLGKTGEDGTLGKSRFWTLGARYHGVRGNWDYDIEVPIQIGKLNGDSLRAWALAAVLGHTFKDAAWTPRLALEFNYATGDRDATSGKSQQFQVLFPTAHKFYGYADVVGWSNLLDLRATVSVKPHPKWRIALDYHWFRRDTEQGAWLGVGGAKVRNGQAGTSKDLGHEFDLVIYWTPHKKFSLQGGWAIFLPGKFIEQTGASPTSNFLYLQALLKF